MEKEKHILPNGRAKSLKRCQELIGIIARWASLAAYVRFEEYAHWYDPQGFDIHDVTHWQKIVLPKEK